MLDVRRMHCAAVLLLVAVIGGTASAAGGQSDEVIPLSNVEGKKLIAATQKLFYMSRYTQITDMPELVHLWQDTGYDGLCLGLSLDPEKMSTEIPIRMDGGIYSMCWRWWTPELRRREELQRDVDVLKSIQWGRFTHNFLLMASHTEGIDAPDWFSDDDWEIVLANTRLGAALAKEIGCKGVCFDVEGYGGAKASTWSQPWDYHLYVNRGYTFEGRSEPRSFDSVYAKVRQRGQQWAAALTEPYPDVVLAVLPGLYAMTWPRVTDMHNGDLARTDCGLWPAFVDGILEGLDERAKLVSFSEATYIQSRYSDLAATRDMELGQAAMLSALPETARRRISFAVGLWTDAGYGRNDRFSNVSGRYNQRNPERHRHATHNALAASDEYAWHWSEWGPDGSFSFLTDKPTALMREYWAANEAAHQPMSLLWEPTPQSDLTDYTSAAVKAAETEACLWAEKAQQGYEVAAVLPEYWKFRLDVEMLSRYTNWSKPFYDDGGWTLLNCRKCWQSQGTKANAVGLYRTRFDAPAGLDADKQEILLAFGSVGNGEAHVFFNGEWISAVKRVVDIGNNVRSGEENLLAIVFLNREGPGGLMGQVKIITRSK